MENIKLDGFLYEENGSYYIRNDQGQIEKIAKNKFNHNQIVQTAQGHFSGKSFTRLLNPMFTKNRGWVYTENYITRNQNSGGCGCCFEENMYEKLIDPADILFAERIYLKEQIDTLKGKLSQCERSLGMIEYALSLSVPDYKNVK
jgi:hypothetical protein